MNKVIGFYIINNEGEIISSRVKNYVNYFIIKFFMVEVIDLREFMKD